MRCAAAALARIRVDQDSIYFSGVETGRWLENHLGKKQLIGFAIYFLGFFWREEPLLAAVRFDCRCFGVAGLAWAAGVLASTSRIRAGPVGSVSSFPTAAIVSVEYALDANAVCGYDSVFVTAAVTLLAAA